MTQSGDPLEQQAKHPGAARDADLLQKAEAGIESGAAAMRHPPGLFLLFIVEMWERFSYYGMRALLVLYLISEMNPTPDPETGFMNPGRGWSEPAAYKLYGLYTGMAYLLPVVGGFIADRILGTHRSMLLGGSIIALGHVVLAVSGFGDLAHNDAGMALFITGLALIILGTGYFKPTVSVMVGQLYRPGDPRRDGGFSIFYMGINVGAFICAFVCGTLGEKVGWHWGFGSAAVGMVLGLIAYVFGKPHFLRGIGDPPPRGRRHHVPLLAVITLALSGLVGVAYHAGVFGMLDGAQSWLMDVKFANWFVPLAVIALVLGGSAWLVRTQPIIDRGPVACILIFILFNAFFWIAFEQAGSTLNVFALNNTERVIFGHEVPASWFQSLNPLFIIVFAPLFAFLWGWLGTRNKNPSQAGKIGLGLILLGMGYVFMVFGAMGVSEGVKVSAMWLLMTYFFHTMGELCLSPTGLSFVTKAAPVRLVSFLMGAWFLSSFVANYGGGLVAAQVEKIERGETTLWWSDWFDAGSRAPFFMLFVVTSIGAGLLILLLAPMLNKALHGRG